MPCPRGTFSTQEELTEAAECTQCNLGKYCGDTGLTAPTGDCDAGMEMSAVLNVMF